MKAMYPKIMKKKKLRLLQGKTLREAPRNASDRQHQQPYRSLLDDEETTISNTWKSSGSNTSEDVDANVEGGTEDIQEDCEEENEPKVSEQMPTERETKEIESVNNIVFTSDSIGQIEVSSAQVAEEEEHETKVEECTDNRKSASWTPFLKKKIQATVKKSYTIVAGQYCEKNHTRAIAMTKHRSKMWTEAMSGIRVGIKVDESSMTTLTAVEGDSDSSTASNGNTARTTPFFC
ncbi:unnamed protein product [Pseudo-nitzschia multistriata]|uniref:Uncharacterized protein n=1 Tax=Pseudo-nitzschia multistriata TaxID=183589 RepID=A0A448YWF4_9STRA|nr:unnamed protein product [Pseudo-nitzschia multistriata]